MTTPHVVRVVIGDDHPMFRYGLRAALAANDGLEIVGEAENGSELVAVVEQTQPDVVITDLTMPGLDGIAATGRILTGAHRPGILVLTMHEDDEMVFAALRAGARGYLLKDADRSQICRAVFAIAAGEAVYGSSVARRIVDFFTGTHRVLHVYVELTGGAQVADEDPGHAEVQFQPGRARP
jgi:DNA-binding NarL/FixJ family response regulator